MGPRALLCWKPESHSTTRGGTEPAGDLGPYRGPQEPASELMADSSFNSGFCKKQTKKTNKQQQENPDTNMGVKHSRGLREDGPQDKDKE